MQSITGQSAGSQVVDSVCLRQGSKPEGRDRKAGSVYESPTRKRQLAGGAILERKKSQNPSSNRLLVQRTPYFEESLAERRGDDRPAWSETSAANEKTARLAAGPYFTNCLICSTRPLSPRQTAHSSNVWRTVVTSMPWSTRRSNIGLRSDSRLTADRSDRRRIS